MTTGKNAKTPSPELVEKVAKLAALVGNTPVRKLHMGNDRYIYLKEEGKNPAGSIKDRPALNMLLQAIREGHVMPDTVVAESTSGNTGVGVAWVCSELGLEYHNYSPASLSEQKQKLLREYGAKLYFSEGNTDQATEMLLARMEEDPDAYFWTSQFTNDNNWKAHVEHTAPELLRQVPDVNEIWVAFGSAGTSTGFAHALQGSKIGLRVVQNTLDRTKRIEGMRNLAWMTKPPIADLDLIGQENMFDTEPDTLLDIARQVYVENDGFVLGPTTAAILTQAIKSSAPTLAVVSPDNGDRYPDWEQNVMA
ncbi:MAG: pyridoxal-phosphate dependent enzyme [Caldilineaceae bacterium]|nr:pyridoxal-phosphate dependent enzyme [Caldilineaceae bacterium]